MKNFSIAILAVLVTLFSVNGAEKGKHLFILSGQSNMDSLDPNITFKPTVEAEFGKGNVIVVKDSMVGQPILRWYKNWKPAKGDSPKVTGDLYERLMKKVNMAISGKKFTTVTFVWMQGEADANKDRYAVYSESLKGLINQFREDMERSDINFVIGRISDARMRRKEWSALREMQVKVAEDSKYGEWVDTDDLNTGVDRSGYPLNDDLHYSVSGYKTLGKRFAEKSIKLISNNSK
jgi:hypothetical protein